jgi:hypothetical protein
LLETLGQELREKSYRPLPCRQVEIPKEGGKVRTLKIPAIRDRVVQGALRLVLEPIFEADFQPGSYGYRPNRTAHEAPTGARGARVLVEDGTVDVHIAPARVGKKQWSFEAGAFAVQVTGTRFKLSYRALDQSFGLAMTDGKVMVAGPCLHGPTQLSAGDRLDLTCLAKPEPLKVADLVPAPAAAPPATHPAGRPPRDAKVWRELLAGGRLQESLEAAERANFATVCQVATARELRRCGWRTPPRDGPWPGSWSSTSESRAPTRA